MAEKMEISVAGRIDIAMGLLMATQVVHPPNVTIIILDTTSEALMEVTTHFVEGAHVVKTLHTTTVALKVTTTGTGAINIEFDKITGTGWIGFHLASIANLPLECLYRL
mmetsp:Transcript_24410/g.58045  ORF Transcript_24410/g.58045 Transcript_24410/m.58045 type:complete len:109 (-) Transcript_24410:190-516(-)